MANHSSWTDIKNQRPAPSAETSDAIEQDLVLGQLIYDLRTQAGLSQRELAQRMGTTQSVISRLEEGGAPGTASTPSPASPTPSAATSSSPSPPTSPTTSTTPSRSPDTLPPTASRRDREHMSPRPAAKLSTGHGRRAYNVPITPSIPGPRDHPGRRPRWGHRGPEQVRDGHGGTPPDQLRRLPKLRTQFRFPSPALDV